ncbi:hypothetical protein [Anaerocolumna cellulosilytica]|nr:hypothetical protein [Anaerocolumna cellulosilytica]MBB5196663.1 hypothetical protein [Anaerocolumna cellulosilytica]
MSNPLPVLVHVVLLLSTQDSYNRIGVPKDLVFLVAMAIAQRN